MRTYLPVRLMRFIGQEIHIYNIPVSQQVLLRISNKGTKSKPVSMAIDGILSRVGSYVDNRDPMHRLD